MGTSITIKVEDQDRQICYERVVNSIIEELPWNYACYNDVEGLKRLAREMDYQLRNPKNWKV